MRTKTRRRPKKRSGIRAVLLAAPLLITWLLLLLPLQGAEKKKPTLDTYATVGVSVYDGDGRVLPNANLILVLDGQSKAKPLEVVADSRGEYVFRVPPGPAHYTLTARAKGYQSQQKSVMVEDQERVEVTFQLERQSK
jgi:hypothetical protein